jgi:hypothetical protein
MRDRAVGPQLTNSAAVFERAQPKVPPARDHESIKRELQMTMEAAAIVMATAPRSLQFVRSNAMDLAHWALDLAWLVQW